jgi:DhnA family fructose-bisphosphate aldolase class Ia
MDHGFFGEPSFLTGIEDLELAVRTLVDAGPDAIQLSPGEAPFLQRVAGPRKPALVLRTDIANVYGPTPPRTLWSELAEDAVGVNGDADTVVTLVRQAVELGADVVKADPTDELDEYGRVVEAAGRVPVLVRGGGRASDEEILHRTEAVLRHGAAGIVYGRNVVQHADPARMTRALMAIVHEGASAEEALAGLAARA